MAETLGMLCDKLTIVKLKEYHSDDPERLQSLAVQAQQLKDEIDEYIQAAINGTITPDRLTFAANKVYKKEGNEISSVTGDIGEIFYQLADVNCKLWHEQEKVYEFETVPTEQKNEVVKQLAVLNLQRNQCIDAINTSFKKMVEQNTNRQQG